MNAVSSVLFSFRKHKGKKKVRKKGPWHAQVVGSRLSFSLHSTLLPLSSDGKQLMRSQRTNGGCDEGSPPDNQPGKKKRTPGGQLTGAARLALRSIYPPPYAAPTRPDKTRACGHMAGDATTRDCSWMPGTPCPSPSLCPPEGGDDCSGGL